jgi:hypothetical protein
MGSRRFSGDASGRTDRRELHVLRIGGFAETMKAVARWKRWFREHSDVLTQDYSTEDIHHAKRNNKVGVKLGWQNTSGVIGLNGFPPVACAGDASLTLEDFLAHLDHNANLLGVEHVGLGLDYFSTDQAGYDMRVTTGVWDPEHYPLLRITFPPVSRMLLTCPIGPRHSCDEVTRKRTQERSSARLFSAWSGSLDVRSWRHLSRHASLYVPNRSSLGRESS